MQGPSTAPLIAASIASAAVAIGSYAVWALRRKLVVVDVRGVSMEPTLRHGDRVLVSRIPADGVRNGDIVVIERGAAPSGDRPAPAGQPNQPNQPNQPDQPDRPSRSARPNRRDWAVKRAVAVAGDPVPASVAAAAGVAPGTAVPAGFLVVLGDNPSRSADSRVWGYLPTERLLGVVRRRLGGG
ncbi:MAG TPA: S26 family signal peptidase [Actinocrinis sp.]|nr:S26 family signal peptidase [Actinocrinis sp.]